MKSDHADIKRGGIQIERAFLDLLVSWLSSTTVPPGRMGPGPGKLVFMGRDKGKDSCLGIFPEAATMLPVGSLCSERHEGYVYSAICWATTAFLRYLTTESTCWKVHSPSVQYLYATPSSGFNIPWSLITSSSNSFQPSTQAYEGVTKRILSFLLEAAFQYSLWQDDFVPLGPVFLRRWQLLTTLHCSIPEPQRG